MHLHSVTVAWRYLPCCLLWIALIAQFCLAEDPATKSDGKKAKPAEASDKFFADPQVVKIRLNIPDASLQKLRENNREYVRCELVENGQTHHRGVAIKLKGAAGSFRELDDKPAFTLNMSRFEKDQAFHGLQKFHLNNSVQDEAWLNELLCSGLFNAAGIPSPRVTHARVWLNDRDLGLYVLKEGFDKPFLKRGFGDASGNLYDGGFLQDVDVDLEKDSGTGPDDFSDLHALRDACQEPDPAERHKRVAAVLNVDRFIDFMALELMTGHWDGYTVNKNNYRIYFDPRTKLANFLPHGMDQMFGDPGFPIFDFPACIVSSAVMHDRAWRKQYRERVKSLLPLFNPPDKLLARVDAVRTRLLPVLKEIGEEPAAAFNDRVNELRQRLIDRAANLAQQADQEEPGPLEFDEHGIAKLPDWYGASDGDEVFHEEPELPGGRQTLSIKCGDKGTVTASWRLRVLLERGRYQFEARAKTANVAGYTDEKGTGAGLRISGSNRENKLTGTRDWTPLRFEFEVLDEVRDVELVAEIRATAGQVWFDRTSLQLKRLPVEAKAESEK